MGQYALLALIATDSKDYGYPSCMSLKRRATRNI